MTAGKPIYWTQGVFLTPQHFQQQDLYHQRARAAFWHLSQAFGWGCRELQWRRDGLAASLFEVTRFELVTPSGVLLTGGADHPAPNTRLLGRAFADFRGEPGEEFDVFLALPRELPDQANVTEDAQDRQPHTWLLTAAEVPDRFAPQEPERPEVVSLAWLASIVFSNEPGFQNHQSRCELVRLARLRTANEGAVEVAEYVPPSLRLDATPGLMGMMKSLRDLMAERSNDFTSLKRQRGIQGTAGTPQDIMRTIILQTLNRFTIDLARMTEQPGTHPEEAYAVLRRIVGELSTFSEAFTVFGAPVDGPAEEGLPAYDHDDIGRCILAADRRIRVLLKQLSVGPEMGIELKYEPDSGYYIGAVPHDFFEGRMAQYFLVIESAISGEDLERELTDTGKLSAPSLMADRINRNLHGIPAEWQRFPPEYLPQRSGRYSYFLLDSRDDKWREIETEGAIGLWAPALHPDETTVMVVKTSADDEKSWG